MLDIFEIVAIILCRVNHEYLKTSPVSEKSLDYRDEGERLTWRFNTFINKIPYHVIMQEGVAGSLDIVISETNDEGTLAKTIFTGTINTKK